MLCSASHEEFVAGLAELPELPTLVLSDISLPGRSGIAGLAVLRAVLPAAEVLLLSVHTDAERVFEALRQGAVGHLEKTMPLPLLKGHLLQVAAGGSATSPSVARHVTRYFRPRPPAPLPSLTPREYDSVPGIEDGLSYKLIAERLGLSLDTVCSYIRQIYRKLEVKFKMEVIAKTRTSLLTQSHLLAFCCLFTLPHLYPMKMNFSNSLLPPNTPAALAAERREVENALLTQALWC